MKVLIDTNILIYAFNGVGRCRSRLAACNPADTAWSSISEFELSYGLAKSARPEHMKLLLTQLRQQFECLSFDAAAAQQAGHLRAHLRAQGTPIGPYDLQIAGIALAHRLTLVTHNTSEFERVPGLKLEDWV